MLISVVNRSRLVSDAKLQEAVRAINRQIAEDFAPYWGFGGTLRLEGAVGAKPAVEQLADLRGEAVLYLWDEVDVEEALGYHDSNARGIPYGFVFTKLAKQLGEEWSVTLSHEALELIADAQGNLLVQGPDPRNPANEVFHWFEMCDAVQSQTYRIEGIEVSNFILPLYFTVGEQEGSRNDFLGVTSRRHPLPSFGVAPGGYIGFFDPRTRSHETYSAPDDKAAAKRLKTKVRNKYGRGYLRKRSRALTPEEARHTEVLAAGQAFSSRTSSTDPIKHVIVLMLENRSFDHMLGAFTRELPGLEGINFARPFSNRSSAGVVISQAPGALAAFPKGRDPAHEHDAVLEQLAARPAEMSGFLASYEARNRKATRSELNEVMAYYDVRDPEGGTPDRLPALHALARNFAICDHWFSSMPGPTWQNRFFVHSGTCLGHVQMPSLSNPFQFHHYYQDTLFDRLDHAGVPWRIYYGDIPQSIVMARQLQKFMKGRGYRKLDKLVDDLAGDADALPAYVFIEPSYFGRDENDQHPPADVHEGEQLIADVYNAIRQNKALWESSLLVVTYDEHGGFCDHVPPPATVPPDAFTKEWSFDRLGVRVPTVLVSPWVDAGVIDRCFDHTSLLRYVCEKWGLEPLGERMLEKAGKLRANTFAEYLAKRSEPRTDTPAKIDRAAPVKGRARPAGVPPNTGAREALLLFVEQLPEVEAAVPKGRKAAARRRRLGPEDRVNSAKEKLDRLVQ